MTPVEGHFTPAFEPLRDVVDAQLRSGEEVGLSLAVDLDGERVVDVWGGHRDAARTAPWERDTITNVWSITKLITALAVLRLVDAGVVDVHAPVARYWPEFAAAGKAEIEVRQLLSHTAGLSGLEQPARLEDLYDVRGAAARLATQAPWWTPGTASGYHVLTYGHLLGELVDRVTGRSLSSFIAEELADPLGADFQLGVRDLDRVSDVIPPAADFDPSVLDHGSVAYRTFTGPAMSASVANSAGWRAAELGAANGHSNASGLADLLSPLTAGRSLFKATTIDSVFTEQSNGTDLVNGLHLRWGLGFALPDPRTLSWIPAGRVGFWGGWGGSMAIVDLDRGLTITYVMNRMDNELLGSARAASYIRTIYACLNQA